MKREKVLDMESRYKFVKVMVERYKRARKKDTGYLLDLVVNSSGYSRCYDSWLLRNSCYVEQKNWLVVRKTVGYLRYETGEEVKMLIIEYKDEKIKQNLKNLYNSLNPVALKKEIGQLQEKLYNIALQKPFYQKRVKDVSFK